MKRRKCFTIFAEAEYRFRKNRETPLGGRVEGEERSCLLSQLLFLPVFLQKTVAFILAMGTPMDEINATFDFSVSLCLKRSGW
jgi:hypothetical protein